MKIAVSKNVRRASARGGFSLPELMIVLAIFSILVAATVSAQIFGMRLYKISETKLTTTAYARTALTKVRDEIQCGRLLYVGNGDSYSFKFTPDGMAHTGNALKICETTDTNQFVYYYVDATDCLNRMVSGSDKVQRIAGHITNRIVFQAEDFQGNILTNYVNNRVIRMTMQFYRPEYSLAKSQGGALYDYYQLQTRIARRAVE